MSSAYDDKEAFREYKKIFQSCRFKAVCRRYVVRVQKLRKWLKSESQVVVDGKKVSQLYRLIEYAYRNRKYPRAPISEATISKDSILTFCVLLNLDHGDLIDTFRRHGLNDISMKSKNKAELKTALEGAVLAIEEVGYTVVEIPDPADLAEKCDQERWQFVAPSFHLDIDSIWNKNVIVPINWKKEINQKGGTAQLWQIAVLEEFLDEDIREKIPHSRFDLDSDDLGPRYQLVVKQFEEEYLQVYNNEKAGFNALRGHKGMVQYFGSFRHIHSLGEEPSSVGSEIKTGLKTSSILLEYGDWDLEDYFFKINPPLRQKEQIDFYKDLFNIAQIVKGVHTQRNDYSKKAYFGWHADIKPSNILLVEDKFKLADLGFMKFIEGTGKEPVAELDGGTWAYGAPEYSIVDHAKVTQSVDVWSLGCVFSVAATWVVGGRKAIKIYSQARINGIKDLNKRGQLHSRRKTGNFFHDGKKVLPEVTAWHSLLRESARKNDCFTIPLLNLIDEKLLLGPAERLSMDNLCKELEEIIANFSAHSHPAEILGTIKQAMLKIDEEAPLDPSSSRVQDMSADRWNSKHASFEGRQARKQATLQAPDLRTTHRSTILQSELGSKARLESVAEQMNNQTGPQALHSQHDAQQRDSPQAVHNLPDLASDNSPQHTQQAPLSRLRHSSGTSSRPSLAHRRHSEHHAQTIHEAHEELIQKRPKNWITKTLRKRSKTKDNKLSAHFINRNIKFLVDNGSSMAQHWTDIQMAVETLAEKARGQSPSGIDLYFTNGSEKLIECQDHMKFREIMKIADTQPVEDVATDIGVSLGTLMTEHIRYLERRKRLNQTSHRKLTLIVFTDGRWQGMRDKQSVRREIELFVQQVIELVGKFEKRPVSIEFIQFGDDSDARTFLRQLDDDLHWESGIPDWIDTEHFNGDVYKMLLGSLVDEMDDISTNDDHIESPTSYIESTREQAIPMRMATEQGESSRRR